MEQMKNIFKNDDRNEAGAELEWDKKERKFKQKLQRQSDKLNKMKRKWKHAKSKGKKWKKLKREYKEYKKEAEHRLHKEMKILQNEHRKIIYLLQLMAHTPTLKKEVRDMFSARPLLPFPKQKSVNMFDELELGE